MRLTNEQRQLFLTRVLDERGVRYHAGRLGWQKVSCYGVGHAKGDRNPSASINLTRGTYKCFGCDLSGDAVDLVMQETGLDFTGALTRLGYDKGRIVEEPTWL